MPLSVAEATPELCKLLSEKKLCIIAGSGVSVDPPASLPTWDGFVNKYIEICSSLNDSLVADYQFGKILKDANTYKNKDVISTVTALKDAINNCKYNSVDLSLFNNDLINLFSNAKCNAYHRAIVSTNYKYILTTNYDLLLEEAARQLKYHDLVRHAYSFKDLEKISAAIYMEQSAIIHVHGKVTGISLEDFVLTADDYKKIKDKNPGFRTLMNSLFMTNSFLMVGYGGNDPHLEDIINDINYNLNWLNSDKKVSLPTYYLVLREKEVSPILEHIKNRNRTKVIAINDFEEELELLQNLGGCSHRQIL